MAGPQSSIQASLPNATTTQRSRFNLGAVVPRRPSQQHAQPQAGLQQISATSSYPSPTQKANAPSASSPGAQAPSLGKTSGWYHGVSYDVSDMWKAATIGDNDLLKRSLKAGLNVNHCKWSKGDKVAGNGARSIADVVARRNDIRAMSLLLEHGVDLSGASVATFAANARSHFDFLFFGDDKRDAEQHLWTTPLHQACRYGHIELVRILLDEGNADSNVRDPRGRTALHMAAMGNYLDVAKFLLAKMAMIDSVDISGVTPLAAAALTSRAEFVELLIDNDADIDALDSHGETAVYNASIRHHSGIVAVLANCGANLDLKNTHGTAPFLLAASRLDTTTMDVLSNFGADVDTRDVHGCTALVRATMAKNVPLIKHLMQLGTDIDAEDSDGWTPLLAAMVHNEEEVINLLLHYGPNVDKSDVHGNTALHQAAMLGSTFVIRRLVATCPSHGVNHFQTNHFGETPLFIACKHNNSPTVKLLLKHGANPRHIDLQGHRAVDRAMYWGSYACVRLLVEAGVTIDHQALLALQQGRNDNHTSGHYDLIISRLRSQHPGIVLPSTTASSRLQDLFARTITLGDLRGRMREKQGKPTADSTLLDGTKKDADFVSPDPFEACIPKPPPPRIINNNTTSMKANGTSGVDASFQGANLALGITNTILNSV